MSPPQSPELRPAEARRRLGLFGRWLYDAQPEAIWERDTATLPRVFRRLRHRYRDFAHAHLVPAALAADEASAPPDVRVLFLEAAREGLQTELLPWPLGTGSPRAMARSVILAPALKAEEFCAASSGLGLALLAHDLGTAPLFVSGEWRATWGWQRRIYSEIAAGQPAVAAFAITEPGAGSDVEDSEGAATARLVTRARPVSGGWRVSGRKCFITNGAIARWVTLFAAEGDGGIDRWTCFLLDNTMSGFGVGRSEHKMGQRGSDASELILDEVYVPADRRIGPSSAGWAINRNVLNFSRPVVGAIAVGIARSAFEHALRFAATARLAGRPLLAYQDIRLALADMMIKIQAGRSLVWQAARYRLPFQAAGAMAKVFCSDMAWEVSRQALELLGDHGMLRARHVERAVRDARLTQIYEGTNQINRLAVFESQLGAEFMPVDY